MAPLLRDVSGDALGERSDGMRWVADRRRRNDRAIDDEQISIAEDAAEMIDDHYRNKAEGYDCDENCHFCEKAQGASPSDCSCNVCRLGREQFRAAGRSIAEAEAVIDRLTPSWLPGAVIQVYEKRYNTEYRHRSVVDFPKDPEEQAQSSNASQPQLPPRSTENPEGSIMPELQADKKPPEVVFQYTRGLTRDLRAHYHLYAIPKDATIKVEAKK